MFLAFALACYTGPPPADEDGDGFGWDVDCDDDNPDVHPGAEEVCNGEDDDCDEWRDEEVVIAAAEPLWWDYDCDGWGSVAGPSSFPCSYDSFDEDTTWDCWTDREGDCDDDDWEVHPSNNEECNGVDDDCDGSVDEEEGAPSTFYADADGDGYGDPVTTTEACAASDAFVADSTDCEDADAEIAPDLPEVCGNGVDDDCSAETTDGCGYALFDLADAARVDGVTAGSETCRAVASTGDVDGDGVGDLVIGAAGAEDDAAWWVPGPFVGETSVSLGIAMVGACPDRARSRFRRRRRGSRVVPSPRGIWTETVRSMPWSAAGRPGASSVRSSAATPPMARRFPSQEGTGRRRKSSR